MSRYVRVTDEEEAEALLAAGALYYGFYLYERMVYSWCGHGRPAGYSGPLNAKSGHVYTLVED